MRRFLRLYSYYFSPDRAFARRLKLLLGYTPINLYLFKLAFSHRSNSSAERAAPQNNERLEFLGDAVLGTIVAEYLFKKYPNNDEGFLTKMRSKIVKRNSLNKIADQMGLEEMLNEFSNTKLSRSMLGNALEALVGAIYLDSGYEKTSQYVIKRVLRDYVNVHNLETYDDNYKSQLLEYCQKNGYTIHYKLLARYKLDKRDRFRVAVLVDGKKIAASDDYNKKSAEQSCSSKALLTLGLITEEDL